MAFGGGGGNSSSFSATTNTKSGTLPQIRPFDPDPTAPYFDASATEYADTPTLRSMWPALLRWHVISLAFTGLRLMLSYECISIFTGLARQICSKPRAGLGKYAVKRSSR